MAQSVKEQLDHFMQGLIKRNPGETEFHQAVYEVAGSILPYIQDKPRVVKILMRLPDGNISAAHLSVLYNRLIRQHASLL